MLTLALTLAAFSLVDPVPADKMRDLATDRPDLTEGPFTVDAGHLQLEMDAVVASLEGDFAGATFAGLNARVGLTDAVDVHLIVPTLGVEYVGDDEPLSSFGDLTLRLKWNLFGNADGDVAVALLPYLVVPGDLRTTGGLIVPVNFNLPLGFGLGAMVQAEVLRIASRRGEVIAPDIVVSASASHAIVGGVGAYLEVLFEGSDFGTIESWASAGTTWQPSADLQFDLGARVRNDQGVGARFEGFAGLTVRR